MKIALLTFAVLMFGVSSFAQSRCTYGGSTESAQKIKLLLDVSNQVPEIEIRMKQILVELGYPNVRLTLFEFCSADNSDGIDYELLRGAVLQKLQEKK